MRRQLLPAIASKASNMALAIVAAILLPLISFTNIAHADINNTRADAWGTAEVWGSGWLSGGGVTIYSNGPLGPGGPSPDTWNCVAISGAPGDSHCSSGNVTSGIEWQCVELVNRLYLSKGWTTTTWSGNGNTLVNNVPTGLTKENDGSISSLNPGDVITLDDGGLGHAGIINSVGTSIQFANQNTIGVYGTASIGSGSLAAGNAHLTLTGWAGYSVQAIVHHPAAATTKYRPAVVTRSDGSTDIYAISGTGYLWHKYFTPSGGWSGWGNLSAPSGGLAAGTPGVVEADDGSTNIYVEGKNGHIWEIYYTPGGGWSGWGDKGVVSGNFTSEPVVIGTPGTLVAMYAVSGSGVLWERYWTSGGGWSGWGNKGNPSGGLAAITPGIGYNPTTGYRNIYAISNSHHLWEIYLNGSGWSGWGDKDTVSGGFTSSPAVVGSPGVSIYIYAVSGSGVLWERYWTSGGGWSGWGNKGNPPGGLSGSPGVALAPSDGSKNIYASSVGGHVWEIYWAPSSGWSGWGDKGTAGSGFGSPPTVTGSSDGGLNLYAISNNSHMWNSYFSSGWSTWNDFDTVSGGF